MIVGWSTWRGSGATTAALTMAMTTAMRIRHPVWLVEADPAGGVLAARLGIDTRVSGLEHLAFPIGTASRTDATSDWFAGAAAIATGWSGSPALVVQLDTSKFTPKTGYKIHVEGQAGKAGQTVKWTSEPQKFMTGAAPPGSRKSP